MGGGVAARYRLGDPTDIAAAHWKGRDHEHLVVEPVEARTQREQGVAEQVRAQRRQGERRQQAAGHDGWRAGSGPRPSSRSPWSRSARVGVDQHLDLTQGPVQERRTRIEQRRLPRGIERLAQPPAAEKRIGATPLRIGKRRIDRRRQIDQSTGQIGARQAMGQPLHQKQCLGRDIGEARRPEPERQRGPLSARTDQPAREPIEGARVGGVGDHAHAIERHRQPVRQRRGGGGGLRPT